MTYREKFVEGILTILAGISVVIISIGLIIIIMGIETLLLPITVIYSLIMNKNTTYTLSQMCSDSTFLNIPFKYIEGSWEVNDE